MTGSDPSAPAQGGGPMPVMPQATGGAWRDGNALVMHKQGDLPDRCVRCNAPANGIRLKRDLSWHHPAIYLIILAGLLIYVIVALIVRKTAKIEVGICKRHRSRRRIGIAVAWLMALLGIATFFLTTEQHAWPVIVGLLLILLSLIVGMIASRVVTPKKIDDSYVWLTGVHPDYLAQLPPVSG